MATIKEDNVMVFSTSAPNAIKAAEEIDNIEYTYIDLYESVVLVSVASPSTWKHSKPKDQFKKAENVLSKYNIGYKYKKF